MCKGLSEAERAAIDAYRASGGTVTVCKQGEVALDVVNPPSWRDKRTAAMRMRQWSQRFGRAKAKAEPRGEW